MDKPTETGQEDQPRRWPLSYFVLLLAIPMFYLAAAGPLEYARIREFGSKIDPGQVSMPLLHAVQFCSSPAEMVSAKVPLYQEYLEWFIGKALERENYPDLK